MQCIVMVFRSEDGRLPGAETMRCAGFRLSEAAGGDGAAAWGPPSLETAPVRPGRWEPLGSDDTRPALPWAAAPGEAGPDAPETGRRPEVRDDPSPARSGTERS